MGVFLSFCDIFLASTLNICYFNADLIHVQVRTRYMYIHVRACTMYIVYTRTCTCTCSWFLSHAFCLDIHVYHRLRRDINERGRDLEGVLKQYNKFVKPVMTHLSLCTCV